MRLKCAVGVWIAAGCGLIAQPANGPLTFEVASIRPAAQAGPGPMRMGIQMMPGGGLRANNVSLRVLLTLAYDVRDFQVSGGPPWLGSQLYDVQARTGSASDAPASPDGIGNMSEEQRKTFQEQMRERLRNLLADRFQLMVHHETKEAPIYTLEVAKGGPKFQESKATGRSAGMMRMGRGELNGEGVGMDFVVQVLANQVGRAVIDKTGLKGKYDMKLTWTPDGPQGFGPGGGPLPGGVEPPAPDPNGPTIFSALQDQLGLKLESGRGPTDMIVIDHVEKASEN
ncbi:MAG TPA: TIGR03435 family protein [Bryobacteraceae bacterium]|nr:TIGR03435 family protein [Bryobacteraceae bacterium]